MPDLGTCYLSSKFGCILFARQHQAAIHTRILFNFRERMHTIQGQRRYRATIAARLAPLLLVLADETPPRCPAMTEYMNSGSLLTILMPCLNNQGKHYTLVLRQLC